MGWGTRPPRPSKKDVNMAINVTQIINSLAISAGEFFKYVNNSEKRKLVACMRSAKALCRWVEEKNKPLTERKKRFGKNVTAGYCQIKINHYSKQFLEREDRLTS